MRVRVISRKETPADPEIHQSRKMSGNRCAQVGGGGYPHIGGGRGGLPPPFGFPAPGGGVPRMGGGLGVLPRRIRIHGPGGVSAMKYLSRATLAAAVVAAAMVPMASASAERSSGDHGHGQKGGQAHGHGHGHGQPAPTGR